MEFSLTDEQKQLRRTVREFADAEILPHVMEWDEVSKFPSEIIPKLAEMGFLGVIFPEKYGGAGMGYVEYAIIIEELSRVDGSIGIIVAAHNSLCTNHIYKFGTEEEKKKYVTPLAQGKKLGCWSLTEPEAGSDAGGTRTTAVRKDGGWLLNGSKTFTTNGRYADVCVGMAVTDASKKSHGISAFIIEKGTPGFRPGKKENKLGLRASDTSEVVFTDCKVPAENLLGKEGEGFVNSLQILDGGRISIAALALGMAQGAYESRSNTRRNANNSASPSANSRPFNSSSRTWPRRLRRLARPGLSRRLARRSVHRLERRDSLHQRVQHGQTLRQRDRRARGQRSRASLRRLRLHQGLSRGEVLPRREALHHRRRHQRNPAPRNRPPNPRQTIAPNPVVRHEHPAALYRFAYLP